MRIPACGWIGSHPRGLNQHPASDPPQSQRNFSDCIRTRSGPSSVPNRPSLQTPSLFLDLLRNPRLRPSLCHRAPWASISSGDGRLPPPFVDLRLLLIQSPCSSIFPRAIGIWSCSSRLIFAVARYCRRGLKQSE